VETGHHHVGIVSFGLLHVVSRSFFDYQSAVDTLSIYSQADTTQDNTIIATAIPRITDDFRAPNDVGWYGSSYLLTTCTTQLLYGKFYAFYSIKWVYLFALLIFEIGSLICGVAPNSTTLIVGRAIAGIGAAGIFSGAILIVANTVPLRKRPTYMGFMGGMYGLASVAGPLYVFFGPSVADRGTDIAPEWVEPSPITFHGAGVSTSIFPSAPLRRPSSFHSSVSNTAAPN
jgi:MFS family permease